MPTGLGNWSLYLTELLILSHDLQTMDGLMSLQQVQYIAFRCSLTCKEISKDL